VTKTLLFL